MKNNKSLYNEKFYSGMANATTISARRIIECLDSHLNGKIESIIDLGCGVGVFLREFQQFYGKDTVILGVDGDYVDERMLVIPKKDFYPFDLKKIFILPEEYTTKYKKFDLAMSTECAEHLPANRAKSFVKDLTRLSDMVLFSAALPYQGGTGHINEQLLSYWVKLFKEEGYELRDIIRPDIWYMEDVITHYRSNVVIFVKEGTEISERLDRNARKQLIDVVNPDQFKYKAMLTTGRLGKLYLKVERIFIKYRGSREKIMGGGR